MNNKAVGIFDSGLGGLTAVRALRALMPEENIVYFADTGRVPYGSKTAGEIRRLTVQAMDFVAGMGVKAIIAACGTVSCNAADLLEEYNIPSFGVLKPGVTALSEVTGDAPLGVIATQASIKSGAFQSELRRLCPERELIAIACPDFVPLIESGHSSAQDAQLMEAVQRYMSPFKAAGAAAVLLGCTHYGIIEAALSAYLGDGTQLISASDCAAREMYKYLTANALTGGGGRESYYTSGSVEGFSSLAASLLGRPLTEEVQRAMEEEL